MKRPLIKIVAVVEKPGVPCWPCIDHNPENELNRILKPVRELNPDMDFDLFRYTSSGEASDAYEEDLKKYDGVLVLLMTCWKGVDLFYAKQASGGIPTIIADVPYCGSGSALIKSAKFIRQEGYPVPLFSTLNYREIAQAMRMFYAICCMKQTRILIVTNRLERNQPRAASQNKVWGCEFIFKSSDDMNAALDKVTAEEAKPIAEKWINEAEKVLEAKEEDIIEGARLHIAIRNLMAENNADAVTVDCLTMSYNGNYSKGTHMYPCLSHHEMLNQGIVAVCEADVNATVTSLLIRYLTGRPGYVSDPVIDTSSEQIIYAHCVACSKVYGHDDPRSCRYFIRSHAEDKRGAAVQVIFPAGEKLTTLYVNENKLARIHSAESVGNVGFDEGCRSKLAAKTNADAVLYNWGDEWHKVTVFGDYRKQLTQLCLIKGIKCVEEDFMPRVPVQ